MGKTGTSAWSQVKNVSGQIRLVRRKEAEYKKPGPNQRFKSGSSLKKAMQKTQEEQRGGRGGRGGRRGGRGRGATLDTRVRRRIKRSQSSLKGAKK